MGVTNTPPDLLRGTGFSGTGFSGTLCSEWGGHEWLDDDPTRMTRDHLALARRALNGETR